MRIELLKPHIHTDLTGFIGRLAVLKAHYPYRRLHQSPSDQPLKVDVSGSMTDLSQSLIDLTDILYNNLNFVGDVNGYIDDVVTCIYNVDENTKGECLCPFTFIKTEQKRFVADIYHADIKGMVTVYRLVWAPTEAAVIVASDYSLVEYSLEIDDQFFQVNTLLNVKQTIKVNRTGV